MFKEEIQQHKLKLERVEKERNELRLNTDRLESRVGPDAPPAVQLIAPSFLPDTCHFVQIADLLAELADERSTSESASQLLETETSERLRLEKDLKDLQVRMHTEIGKA